ncbi:MAG: hypothetical protein ACYTG5_06290 [Planctomycetota bacterium]|jgi:hypothetical protein
MKRFAVRCLFLLGLLGLCPSCSFLQDEFFVFDVAPPSQEVPSGTEPEK